MEKIWLFHIINAVATAALSFYCFKYLEKDLSLLLPLLSGFLLVVFGNSIKDGNKALYFISCGLVLFNILFIPIVSLPKSLLRQPEMKWILAFILLTNILAGIRYVAFQFWKR